MTDHGEKVVLTPVVGEGGGFTGPDGIFHDDIYEAMYFECLDFCGCGHREELHQLVIDCLKAVQENATQPHYKAIEEIVKQRPDEVAQLILHYLYGKKLTDHGGSVYGSFLTPRGKQMIEIGAAEEGEAAQ